MAADQDKLLLLFSDLFNAYFHSPLRKALCLHFFFREPAPEKAAFKQRDDHKEDIGKQDENE